MRSMFAVVLVFVLGVAGCGGGGGGDSTAPSAASIQGTYDLKTVNGAALPFTSGTIGTTYRTEITAEVFTAIGTSFTDVTTYKETNNGQILTYDDHDSGTFALNGTAAVFYFKSGYNTAGTVNGNTFTLTYNGRSSVFQKR